MTNFEPTNHHSDMIIVRYSGWLEFWSRPKLVRFMKCNQILIIGWKNSPNSHRQVITNNGQSWEKWEPLEKVFVGEMFLYSNSCYDPSASFLMNRRTVIQPNLAPVREKCALIRTAAGKRTTFQRFVSNNWKMVIMVKKSLIESGVRRPGHLQSSSVVQEWIYWLLWRRKLQIRALELPKA